MRLTISGAPCTGKTTLINDFIAQWPMYKLPSNSYRDILKEKNYPHSKLCTQEGQWAILNHMIDEMQKYTKDDFVIFDRCPLDNLMFSLWSFEKNATDIDQKFIDKCIPIVRESLRQLDIIFFTPISRMSPISIEDNGFRETDPNYIAEVDNLFKGMLFQYQHNLEKTVFFPNDDSPAMIEVFGNREQRIQLLKMYLADDGKIIGEDQDTVLNPNNILELEKLVLEQATEAQKEAYYKKQKSMVNDFEKAEKKMKKRGAKYR